MYADHHDDPAYLAARAALAPGECPMLIRYDTAEIRDPSTGEYHTVTLDQGNVRAHSALAVLLFNGLHDGFRNLRKPPMQEYRHPRHCPLCAEAELPGPAVYGLWLAHDWHRDRIDLGGGGIYRELERFPNRATAERVVADRLQWLRTNTGGLARHGRRELHRYVHQEPRWELTFIHPTSQLWLWTTEPTGPRLTWPDEALIIDVNEVRTLTHHELRGRRTSDEIREAQLTTPRTFDECSNGAVTTLDNHQICWFTDSFGVTKVRSVRDLGDTTTPARRIHQ